MSLAPIVLFVYNRPWHTLQTVESLQNNGLAQESELFIYCDAAKNESEKPTVAEVRAFIKSINGFKKITIIERDKNWGLADSIIDGVTTIVNQFGKVIVLEDDLVTSPCFLRFMNEALDFYQNEEKVWHISGWNYPISTEGLDDVFLWRLMNCWGWATWSDKWHYYEKDTDKVLLEFSDEQINYLNLDGYNDAWSQIRLNKINKINTWAIYWYTTIVRHNALCMNPTKTYVENIGLDSSGTHCKTSDLYKVNEIQLIFKTKFVQEVKENVVAVERVKDFFYLHKAGFIKRVFGKIKRVFNV